MTTNLRKAGGSPALASATALLMSGALAQPADPPQLAPANVLGHYENGVGTSNAASEGAVTQRLIANRPALRPAEVLEFVPGVIVTQHSGDGKANQYFLRGFNLDHGTDFATFVDGMPVNMVSHAHGQGYSDLNFLIPELVSRIALPQRAVFRFRRRLRLGRQRTHLVERCAAARLGAGHAGRERLPSSATGRQPRLRRYHAARRPRAHRQRRPVAGAGEAAQDQCNAARFPA